MDIDAYLNDILDPVAGILKEVNLDDVYNLLGEPAKTVEARDKSLYNMTQRKRLFSMLLLDLDIKSKY